MDNKVLDKVEEIVEYLEDTDEYKKYIDLKEKLDKNEEVKILINDIKILQKKAVKEEHEGKDIKDMDLEIDNKLKILNNNIMYQEYVDIHAELNDEFQNIKFILDKYFYDKLN